MGISNKCEKAIVKSGVQSSEPIAQNLFEQINFI
jgi:hypothetical protein